MRDKERRSSDPDLSPERLSSGLTPEQLVPLQTLELFGRDPAFVRRPLFKDPIPGLFDRAGARCVVLEPDGSIDESHGLELRL